MAAAVTFSDQPYEVGDRPELTLSFTRSGAAFDPDTINLTTIKPDGQRVVNTTLDFANPATGQYTINIPLDVAGLWKIDGRATHVSQQFAGITFEFSVNGI